MIKDWKKTLVEPKASLKEALVAIDSSALKIALVSDQHHHLLGTLSDGDIRRALIKGADLSERVENVMCADPTVVDRAVSRESALRIMDERELNALPVVDEGKIVGLFSLNELLHEQRKDNPVFIMAGGFGTRLKPLTDDCPKPMLKVGGVPILEIVVRQLVKLGFHNLYISTHYLAEQITQHFGDGAAFGANITYVHEHSPLGTGGALGLLPESLEPLPLIMMNCDVLTTLNFSKLLSFHNKHGCAATMCVREHEYRVPFGVVETENTLIKAMKEKPTYRYNVNAGIYVINPDVIADVSPGERIDMPTLLERNLDKNVAVYTFHDYWLDIGRMDDFERAQRDVHTLGVV